MFPGTEISITRCVINVFSDNLVRILHYMAEGHLFYIYRRGDVIVKSNILLQLSNNRLINFNQHNRIQIGNI